MKILGIETSFDETAAGVVEDGYILLSNAVLTSMEQHIPYGGVVPEIAARSHIEAIMPVIEEALAIAKCSWDDIDAIAVTYGAGLGGSLLIGVLTARTLAIIKNKPLYAINHVEAHLYASFLTQTSLPGYKLPSKQPEFPMLGLIVSGAHSQLVFFKNHFDYKLLGQTKDDAIGEAFDKVARLLGLPYPGGPSVARAALNGNPNKYKLPKAQMHTLSPGLIELRKEMKATSVTGLSGVRGNNERRASRTDGTVSEVRKQVTPQSFKSADEVGGSAGKQASVASSRGYDFSFSGPKTAVLRLAQQLCVKSYDFPSFELAGLLNERQKADIAASFQYSAIETVVDKTFEAYKEFRPKSVVIGGGVASSPELRRQLEDRFNKLPHPAQDMRLGAGQGATEEAKRAVQDGMVSENRRSATQSSAKNAGGVGGTAGKQIGMTHILSYTDPKLCTDNGAMIATLGCFKAKLNQPPANPYNLEIVPNLSM